MATFIAIDTPDRHRYTTVRVLKKATAKIIGITRFLDLFRILTGFFYFITFKLMKNGKTVIEYMERKSISDEEGKFIKEGIWNNLQYNLGNNILTMFLPVPNLDRSQNGYFCEDF